MSILSLATGGLWKYATIGIGAIGLISTAGIGIDDFVTHRERNAATKDLAAANVQIGLDKASIASLQSGINAQNASISAQAAIGKAKLDAASALVATYQSSNAALVAQKNALLNKPLVGATPCARSDDADKRILEDLQ